MDDRERVKANLYLSLLYVTFHCIDTRAPTCVIVDILAHVRQHEAWIGLAAAGLR